ncbi:hypothetical protein BX600DRAFT_461051 [Xylariales sp. PMI_506]|nr:hypothetical protein BX600DRAFT_461051 [Xylariales sp. PMI_506]
MFGNARRDAKADLRSQRLDFWKSETYTPINHSRIGSKPPTDQLQAKRKSVARAKKHASETIAAFDGQFGR